MSIFTLISATSPASAAGRRVVLSKQRLERILAPPSGIKGANMDLYWTAVKRATADTVN